MDFTECDLTGSVFDRCDLRGALFDATVLERCDMRGISGYSIDPARNRLRRARFSLDGGGLLGTYGIEIE